MTFLSSHENVMFLRRGMRDGNGIVHQDDLTLACAHVMAFTVEDVEEEKNDEG